MRVAARPLSRAGLFEFSVESSDPRPAVGVWSLCDSPFSFNEEVMPQSLMHASAKSIGGTRNTFSAVTIMRSSRAIGKARQTSSGFEAEAVSDRQPTPLEGFRSLRPHFLDELSATGLREIAPHAMDDSQSRSASARTYTRLRWPC
jgi:hypothetical protein